jgi:DNA-binding NtrC family response regulator
MGREARELDQKDIELLKSYNWPGNVRELQNVIERAVIISSGSHITLQRVIPSPPLLEHSGSPLITKHLTGEILTASELQRLECDSYTLALERTGWRVSGVKGAAHLLGINPSTFVSRMKKLGIERP